MSDTASGWVQSASPSRRWRSWRRRIPALT